MKGPRDHMVSILVDNGWNRTAAKGFLSWLDIHLDEKRSEDEQLLHDAASALLWCSGSSDFSPGGIAHNGWLKIRPVLDRLLTRAGAHQKTGVDAEVGTAERKGNRDGAPGPNFDPSGCSGGSYVMFCRVCMHPCDEHDAGGCNVIVGGLTSQADFKCSCVARHDGRPIKTRR
jgi:hypothetical protein